MSTVIKAGEAGPLLKRLSRVDLADHLAEARAVIADARRRAAQVVADAEARRSKAEAEARRRGYEAGFAEGRPAGMETGRAAAFAEAMQGFESQHASVVSALEAAIADFDARKRDLLLTARRDVLDFALAIAAKLTLAIGRTHDEAVEENLERALRLIAEKTDLTICVHPQDMESARTFAGRALRCGDDAASVQFVEDEKIAPGGCIVQTDRTSVDATLTTQIDQLVSLLTGRDAADD